MYDIVVVTKYHKLFPLEITSDVIGDPDVNVISFYSTPFTELSNVVRISKIRPVILEIRGEVKYPPPRVK